MVTYTQQLKEIADNQSIDNRVKLAASIDEVIRTYQKAYKDNMGSVISKPKVICKLMSYGSSRLEQETKEHFKIAADRKKYAAEQ